MYEDTDIGNLIRLNCPIEHWLTMMEKILPYAKYWHVKNHIRIEDRTKGIFLSYPTSPTLGLVNYWVAIAKAIALGVKSAFICENYGGDGLTYCLRVEP